MTACPRSWSALIRILIVAQIHSSTFPTFDDIGTSSISPKDYTGVAFYTNLYQNSCSWYATSKFCDCTLFYIAKLYWPVGTITKLIHTRRHGTISRWINDKVHFPVALLFAAEHQVQFPSYMAIHWDVLSNKSLKTTRSLLLILWYMGVSQKWRFWTCLHDSMPSCSHHINSALTMSQQISFNIITL